MRLLCLSLTCLLLATTLAGAQSEKPQVKVTAVFDGPSPVFDAITEDLAREIQTQLSDRFDVALVPLSFEGDWTAEGVERQLDEAYADPEIAAVFGFGHLAVRAVAARKDLPKPTILPFVFGARQKGLPRRGDVSGKRNLCYISEELDIRDEAARLEQVAGSKRIVLLAEESQRALVSSVTGIEGVTAVVAEPTVEALLAAIPKTADGLILTPMRQLSLEARVRLCLLYTSDAADDSSVG